MNSRLMAFLFLKLIEKYRCVLLTLISSTCQFHRNRKQYIFHTKIYKQHKTQDRKVNNFWNGKMFQRFLWSMKTIWILQQPSVLLRTFWSFVVVWRNNFPRKGRISVNFFFSAVNTRGLFKYNWSKNVCLWIILNTNLLKTILSKMLNHYES